MLSTPDKVCGWQALCSCSLHPFALPVSPTTGSRVTSSPVGVAVLPCYTGKCRGKRARTRVEGRVADSDGQRSRSSDAAALAGSDAEVVAGPHRHTTRAAAPTAGASSATAQAAPWKLLGSPASTQTEVVKVVVARGLGCTHVSGTEGVRGPMVSMISIQACCHPRLGSPVCQRQTTY